VVGFFLLFAFVAPHRFAASVDRDAVFGVGLGVTAYTLGMRHAFDIDHISAIDNVTRKLLADGQRPLSVGFYFSLGHSTIVFALTALLALGIRGLNATVGDDSSTLHDVTGVVGPAVSGVFLVMIGLINLVILLRVVGVFRRMRRADLDEVELEDHLQQRGFMTRVLGRATRSVRKPWHMYPLGLLFGLGFDTATEIALLATAGAAAAADLPFYAILCLPVLFAAGMTLFDTLDGVFMSVAYGWAFARPVRKVFYNMTVTALSVAVALGIGTVELLQVLSDRLAWHGAFWEWLRALDFNAMGYALVGLFVVTWVLAVLLWRVGRVEDRWSPDVQPAEGA
jgi:high-affinity nickel-transport protein